MYYGASPKLFEFAKTMRFSAATEEEKQAWLLLTSDSFKKYKFRRQHPIAHFIADFYSHQLKLVIEIDGSYHLRKEQKAYDIFRDEDMVAFGIKVMRFTNEEVSKNINSIAEKISAEISKQGR